MLKKYQSKSCISLSVQIGNGKSVHVSFDGLTGGGSVFYTKDEELQSALEKHSKFGKLFTLAQKTEDAKPAKPVVLPAEDEENADAVEGEDTEAADETADENEGLRPINATDWEDAREYLANTYGVSRSKIRSQKTIVEAAKANGIVFVGI